jgi:hypothetical protein
LGKKWFGSGSYGQQQFIFVASGGQIWCRILATLSKFDRACEQSKLLFSSPNSPLNFTMQKEDFLSHQNVGKCMEY